MKPYYEHAGIRIFVGDSREIVPHLGRFDLLLTDPPYGLRDKLQGGTWGKSFDGDYKYWDAFAPDMQFAISTSQKSVIWGGNYFILPPSRHWLIWNKPERGLTMADAELAWCSWDGNIRVFDSPRNPDGKREHPTQKPLELMRWCLLQAGEPKTVLDPFMGSGTTLRSCKDVGIECVGIDREERYCEIAARRLEQEVFAF